MGYVRDLRALGGLRSRCRLAWQPHLENTRKLIIESAEGCERHGTALVVGTGLLFDIPVAELARMFERVLLVDIVHLWAPRQLVQKFDNVELIECDITDVVERVYRSACDGQLPRLSTTPPNLFHDMNIDLAVSVNILSQLPVLPNAFLSRRIMDYNEQEVSKFSRHLTEDHLDWLSGFQGRACLIADLERLFCKGHRVVKRQGSQWGVRLPQGFNDWYWNLAPRPDLDQRYDIRHRVAGYTEFPKQAWLRRSESVTS